MLNRVIDDLERALASDAEILDREGITRWLMQFSAGLPLELEHPRMGKISYRGIKFAGSVIPTFDRYVALQVDDLVEKHVRNVEAEMATVSADQLDTIARDAATAIERTRTRLISRAGQVKAALLKGSPQRAEALIDRSGVRPMNPTARFAARAAELKVAALRAIPQPPPSIEVFTPSAASVGAVNDIGTQVGVELRSVAAVGAAVTLGAVVVRAPWNTGAARGRVLELIDSAEKNLSILRELAVELDRQARSHNNPPELVDEPPIDLQDMQVALAATPVLRRLVQQQEPDRDTVVLVQRAFDSAQRAIARFLLWFARFENDATKAAATAFGTIIGGALAVGGAVLAARAAGIDLQTIKDMIEAALKLL